MFYLNPTFLKVLFRPNPSPSSFKIKTYSIYLDPNLLQVIFNLSTFPRFYSHSRNYFKLSSLLQFFRYDKYFQYIPINTIYRFMKIQFNFKFPGLYLDQLLLIKYYDMIIISQSVTQSVTRSNKIN